MMATSGCAALAAVNPRKVARRQLGAALLLAMMIAALVATFASGALWVQWRSIALEEAMRKQSQARWLIEGAMDWVRLVLREDARSDQNHGRRTDHAGEPWALPLKEIKLSSFLSTHMQSNADLDLPVFLSGDVQDAQAKLNLANGWNTRDAVFDKTLKRLFDILQLPGSDYRLLMNTLSPTMTHEAKSAPASDAEPRLLFMPRSAQDLAVFGLQASTIAKLSPHVTWLPESTTVNFLTASAEVLYACGMDLASARSWVQERDRLQFEAPDTIMDRIGPGKAYAGLDTRFFWVTARLRMDDWVSERRSLVNRQGLRTRILYTEGL